MTDETEPKAAPEAELQWPAEALAPTAATRARRASAVFTTAFWILDAAAVPGLREAAVPTKSWLGKPRDGFTDYLKQHGRAGPRYTGSAAAFGALLGFLRKRGIQLQPDAHRELAAFLVSQRGGAAFVLTAPQGRPHLERLNPFLFLESELRDHYNAAHDSSDVQIGKPMLDGVVAIRDCLRSLASDSVALLLMG